ncbi:type VII secretion-associated serine protease mycosin [Kitasatospora sp. NPDC050543]|uniref:type VII secretion-associated serine protease mycosin n=1 Tax=Kitasatospora sp. NPDC050543 TaxID=3364054 RepID=UPI00379A49A8
MLGLAAPSAMAADSIRDQQWHLDAMKAPEMWQTTKGAGITVAVIDSGFKLDHPDLVGQFLPGKDFSGLPGGVGAYKESHGTEMVGLIAATGKGLGGKGAYGLAPAARILPIKIKNDDNSTGVTASEFFKQIGQAITYAADQGAKIISISQASAGAGASTADFNALKSAVSYATSKGSLVVAGVGNSAAQGNPVEYPAALPGVVGVGATDRAGAVTSESERGRQVDLAAPGMDMFNACTAASGYCKGHGTSDATALVSGSAALLWSVHPEWTANQILRVLINTAGKPQNGASRTDQIGYGIVRPRVALATPGDPGPANVSQLDSEPDPSEPAPGSSAPATDPGQATTAPASPAASEPGAAPSGTPGEGSEPVDVPGTKTVAADANSDSGSGNLPLIIGGGVVGVLLVGGVVFALLRRRSAATAASPEPVAAPAAPAAPQSSYGQQLPPQGGPGTPPPPPVYEPPATPPGDNPYAQ